MTLSSAEVRKQSLSVFFPCHNEADNIGALVDKTVAVLRKLVDDFEVIIVNDGSKDKTREVADALAAKYPEVRAVHHEVNKGYGGAVWTGLRSATKQLVFFTDGDGQFDISEIEQFLPEIGEKTAVVGYRIKRRDPFHRVLFAKGWKMLNRILFAFRVRDIDCAFKLFRTEWFKDIEPQASGALVTVEILTKLTKKGIKFKQIGVHHYPRTAGTQSGGSIKVILRAFRELFRFYRQLK